MALNYAPTSPLMSNWECPHHIFQKEQSAELARDSPENKNSKSCGTIISSHSSEEPGLVREATTTTTPLRPCRIPRRTTPEQRPLATTGCSCSPTPPNAQRPPTNKRRRHVQLYNHRTPQKRCPSRTSSPRSPHPPYTPSPKPSSSAPIRRCQATKIITTRDNEGDRWPGTS